MYDLHKVHKETSPLDCKFSHIDGTQSAKERNKAFDWLKEDAQENVCRVLTNIRCLSEGDVPAFDAVMFLHLRKSHVDVIQAGGAYHASCKGEKERLYHFTRLGICRCFCSGDVSV